MVIHLSQPSRIKLLKIPPKIPFQPLPGAIGYAEGRDGQGIGKAGHGG